MLASVAAALVALSPFPGVPSAPVCGAEGIPYPQAALAADGAGGLWLACRAGHKLLQLDGATGATVRSLPTPGLNPWSVAIYGGRLWTVDRDRPLLVALDAKSGKVKTSIALPGLPVVLYAAAGYVWIGFTAGQQVARIDPKTRKLHLITAGDGVSGFASDGHAIYVVSHRDNGLVRINPRTGRSRIIRRPVVPTSGATEHVAYLAGALWITGRRLALLRVNPARGNVESTISVGPAGVDVIAAGARIIVLTATDAGAARGDPIVASVQSVDPATNSVASTIMAQASVYSAGIAAAHGHIWLADVVDGGIWAVG